MGKPFQFVKTVEGESLEIRVFNEKVYVNNAQVTTANVEATNGVVHIVDHVLLPPSTPTPAPTQPAATKNIVELAASVPDLSTLVTALKGGKLVDTLESAGPFTVFAPTNEAFRKLDDRTLAYLLDPSHIKELDSVLTYHVLPEAVQSKDPKPFQNVRTVQGDLVRVVVSGGSVYVNNAQVVTPNVEATNGVVHVIDHVLIPYKTAIAA